MVATEERAWRDEVQEWDRLHKEAVEAIAAFAENWRGSVPFAEAERALRQIARAFYRLRDQKITAASLRRHPAAQSSPLSQEWLVMLVRCTALRLGIGRRRQSEEDAIAAATKVIYADLSAIERRAVAILLGAKRRPRGAGERDAQRIADLIRKEWPGEVLNPVGRPRDTPSLTTLVVRRDPKPQPQLEVSVQPQLEVSVSAKWKVPISAREFVGVALPIFAASANVDRDRLAERSGLLLKALIAVAAYLDIGKGRRSQGEVLVDTYDEKTLRRALRSELQSY
jgi:hypothetical protein